MWYFGLSIYRYTKKDTNYNLAVLINVRQVVRLTTSWDDDVDVVNELNKLLVPVLIKALDYDIQSAAINTVSAVQSGVCAKINGSDTL